MKYLMMLAVLLCAVQVSAQDRLSTSLFVAGAISDGMTTWRDIHAGHEETNLAYAFTSRQPTGVVISLAVTDAMTLWLAHHYAPTHPKLVKGVLLTLSGVRFSQAARNAHIWYTDTHQPIFVRTP